MFITYHMTNNSNNNKIIIIFIYINYPIFIMIVTVQTANIQVVPKCFTKSVTGYNDASLFVRRAGEQEEERSGGGKEQSETENALGQTRHHRRDVKLADVEMEAVIGASVRRAG